MNDPQSFESDAPATSAQGKFGNTALCVVFIATNALGAAAYAGIAATVIGYETCNFPGADGGADFVAGLYFLPVLLVVVLASVGCLARACYVYGKLRYWPMNRYALVVPVFWAIAALIVQWCPQ